uniref:Putative secreted protein n=1 Tax=Anopheles darlingi TaxID=43151 RepID=A0A2M4D4S1_ANODA
MLAVCVLLLLGLNARCEESDSVEQQTTEPSIEPQENVEQENVVTADEEDTTPGEVRLDIVMYVNRPYIFPDDFRLPMNCYQT